ncbi:MAG: cytochrome c oxidase accessory protein CcoG [Gammaproteobacteria bacterium]|nr:cytochrome c oxidase accessory protein CcoG [Gammaproteobacteria bacterium]MDH5653242.1 cytochrome c oxidase accessory protein CcoG [Gammaproteobacteria bacterium]
MAEQLIQKRIPVVPRSVSGRFRALKYAILLLAYSVYYLLPWLRWERSSGPNQAVLFDIVGRKFYLFDLVVYAQDIFWLAGFLIIAAFLLFFVTSIAGRVFCGYFCFQTLWTDVFVLIERLVQGERTARIKLINGPMNGEKFIKLTMTKLLWLLVALLTGLSFTLYWGNAPELLQQLVAGTGPFPAYATTLFLTATTFVMAGLAREQVCTYMCPYSRFQAVMFDQDTLLVAYDEKRGEAENGRWKPVKGLLKREERQAKGYGDCIDCGFCVQVCPTGIDIRNGIQYQCISCALCIDACNTIMDSINYPRDLIRYSSENELHGKQRRWYKPKNIGYALMLLLISGILVWSVATRVASELRVNQIRQPLYVVLSDGHIQNRYEIKITNKTDQPQKYHLALEGLSSAELDSGYFSETSLGPGESQQLQVRVKMPPDSNSEKIRPFYFVLQSRDTPSKVVVKSKARFNLP